MPTSSKRPRQLAIHFVTTPNYSRENYICGDARTMPLRLLLNRHLWMQNLLVISGERGSGKTHLAHIYKDHFSVPMIEGQNLNLNLLPILADKGCVIDRTESAEEHLLFHLINLVKANDQHIVFTSRHLQSQLPIALADLRSRLMQGATLKLSLPKESVLFNVLLKHLMERNLYVTSSVISYILLRIPRSYSSIAAFVEFLDRLSFEQKAEVTIPFVRQCLHQFQCLGDGENTYE